MMNEELVKQLRALLVEELGREREGIEDGEPDAIDLQFELDMLGEVAMKVGDSVFSLEWDSGGPGAGAGTETVYRLAGKYLYLSASFGWQGPYETLDDAYGTVVVNAATRSVWCSEWSEEEIISRIDFYDAAPPVLYINGVAWPFETLEHRCLGTRAAVDDEREDEGQ